MATKLISDKSVAEKIGCSRGHVWGRAKSDPEFPKPIKLAGKALWVLNEIEAYLERKITEYRAAPTSRAGSNALAGKKSAEARAARKMTATAPPEAKGAK